MEWVEKTFFDWLNKLFVISSRERHHQTLFIDRNLLVVVRESQSYVISILPRLAPKVLVPSEHHILKDLIFYEEARAIDTMHRDYPLVNIYSNNIYYSRKVKFLVVEALLSIMGWFIKGGLSIGFFMSNMTSEVSLSGLTDNLYNRVFMNLERCKYGCKA